MKRLSILGSTGYIGSCTLEMVARYPDRFSVAGLAAGKNLAKLAGQINAFKPAVAAVQDETLARELREMVPASRQWSAPAGYFPPWLGLKRESQLPWPIRRP